VDAFFASASTRVEAIGLTRQISSLTCPCGLVVRPPERRQVPAEVQFEVARNAVTDIADLGSARLCTGQGQQWEEQVVARLKLRSCRRPEPIDLGFAAASVSRSNEARRRTSASTNESRWSWSSVRFTQP
jgi:hypothetical protein